MKLKENNSLKHVTAWRTNPTVGAPSFLESYGLHLWIWLWTFYSHGERKRRSHGHFLSPTKISESLPPPRSLVLSLFITRNKLIYCSLLIDSSNIPLPTPNWRFHCWYIQVWSLIVPTVRIVDPIIARGDIGIRLELIPPRLYGFNLGMDGSDRTPDGRDLGMVSLENNAFWRWKWYFWSWWNWTGSILRLDFFLIKMFDLSG